LVNEDTFREAGLALSPAPTGESRDLDVVPSPARVAPFHRGVLAMKKKTQAAPGIKKNQAASVITCTPKYLPKNQWVSAAKDAVGINPLNAPQVHGMSLIKPGFMPQVEHLAAITKKIWHTAGVRLTVGFLDNPPADLRSRILEHMNAWNQTANVEFVETSTDPQVRITRGEGGFWSFIGTDILSIPPNEPTMNLQDFTMSTPESEFHRVVRHETGHTLGFPHEHMRRELVNQIDPDKAIAFFGATQGWSPDEVRQQVLTPIEESSILHTLNADPNSIMCYQIPGTITKDGQPIVGGLDIDDSDFAFAATIYPQPGSAPAPLPAPHSTAAKRKGGTVRLATVEHSNGNGHAPSDNHHAAKTYRVVVEICEE
jgi:hypothetical protein